MFSQFSPSARAIITLAEQECRNANHYFLGTEHILLAMAIAPPPDITEFFQTSGIEQWQLKRALREAMQTVFERSWEGVIITPRVQRVCALAETQKGSNPVQPIDLLQAIVADGGGVAARVLQTFRKEPAKRSS